ncbi:Asp23/Gls24 family envelope stress response protein [Anaerocolumna sp.]|uniref:Asp23/Gls24 family envelope stress response protein n=1 Tax=Anaerocolumna sp. TaxID=2041569 RepID=UPI0028A762E1|nr:Asp23/Gls24 family envelope stress response protein [Anaerocolumna sp.]
MTVNKEQENRNTYQIHASSKVGEVQIADEVVATIAGMAATEVEGVASMASNITNELVSKLGMRNLSKGVKIDVNSNAVSVDLVLTLEYGYNIPNTSKQVQEKVKSAIESMTGLNVSNVNIRITGVNIDKKK